MEQKELSHIQMKRMKPLESKQIDGGEWSGASNRKTSAVNETRLQTQSNQKEEATTHSKHGSSQATRSIEIKSTKDALNAIADPQSKNWFVPRTGENQVVSNQVIDYESEANRLTSFIGRWSDDACVSPPELADAGLYYTGPGDRVQCAFCRGGLYNWTEPDTAIGEHIRHFPNCRFIQTKIAELVSLPHGGKASGSTKASRDSVCQATMKIIKDMGYSDDLVNKAMEKLTISEVTVSVDKLLDMVFSVESDEESQITLSQNDDRNDEDSENNSVTSESDVSESQDFDTKKTYSLDLKSLEEENSTLKGRTLCKICMESEVHVLFLPCRHLVCCENCGSMLKNCPVCRTVIIGTVNTYLS